VPQWQLVQEVTLATHARTASIASTAPRTAAHAASATGHPDRLYSRSASQIATELRVPHRLREALRSKRVQPTPELNLRRDKCGTSREVGRIPHKLSIDFAPFGAVLLDDRPRSPEQVRLFNREFKECSLRQWKGIISGFSQNFVH